MRLHHHGEVLFDIPRGLHLFHFFHAAHHGVCHRFDYRITVVLAAKAGRSRRDLGAAVLALDWR